MSSQNKLAWKYTDDDGNEWRRSASKAITDQLGTGDAVKVGGSDGSAVELPFDSSRIKPRVVLVESAAKVKRRVVCYDVASTLWDGTDTTITLETGGSDVSFTVYGREGERKRYHNRQAS